MNKFLWTSIFAAALGGFFTAQAQNGFVVLAKGSNCARQLTFNQLNDGKLGAEKVAVTKGPGADIHVQISYDGKWLAFSRSTSGSGSCDYHGFNSFDIYIAHIDNGKNLPAAAIKVAHGYWASWGDDSDQPTKTLYFTTYSDQAIQKTTVSTDGSFTPPKQHAKCTYKASGSSAHTQGSPDGKYIAYRQSSKMHIQDVATGKKIYTAGGGCHPSWGPRGYFAWAQNGMCRIENGKGKKLGSAGVGKYWYGISNDVHYDKGNMYIIGKMGGGSQNGAGPVELKTVDVSGNGWKIVSSISVGQGNSSDVHIFGNDNTSVSTNTRMNKFDNESMLNTKVISSASGSKLVITALKLAGYTAELYNIQGKKVASLILSGSLQNIMPLQSITDGKYLLKLSNNGTSLQKELLIAK